MLLWISFALGIAALFFGFILAALKENVLLVFLGAIFAVVAIMQLEPSMPAGTLAAVAFLPLLSGALGGVIGVILVRKRKQRSSNATPSA